MRRLSVSSFLISATAGAVVWGLSPLFFGHAEPWDADGPWYLVALAVAGAVAGALRPGSLWAHYLGAVAGQLGYQVLFLKVGPLLPLGVAFLLVYSLLFLAGAALATWARGVLSSGGHVR